MSCTTVYYWVGTTNERFTVDNTIQESTNIIVTPNSGSNAGGAILDSAWVASNFNVVNKFTFREPKTHIVNTIDLNAHLLIIVPNVLRVEEISEKVFSQYILMTDDLHFADFPLSINGKAHTCYYLRDLTSTTFPVRQFSFKVLINI
jgi:hypothetical protein